MIKIRQTHSLFVFYRILILRVRLYFYSIHKFLLNHILYTKSILITDSATTTFSTLIIISLFLCVLVTCLFVPASTFLTTDRFESITSQNQTFFRIPVNLMIMTWFCKKPLYFFAVMIPDQTDLIGLLKVINLWRWHNQWILGFIFQSFLITLINNYYVAVTTVPPTMLRRIRKLL